MSTQYRYTGELTNIGRFGHIKKGDIVSLTTTEEAGIMDDPRFEKVDPKKEAKADKPKPTLNLPENYDQLSPADQKKAMKKATDEEADRIARLEDENKKTQIEEIRQMPKDQLLEFVKKLRADDKKVDVKEDATPKQLRKAIIDALFGANTPGDEGGEE